MSRYRRVPVNSDVRRRMRERIVTAIEVDDSGRLLVRPAAETGTPYERVYREANGLRWDKEERAFCAYEPTRWTHEELLQHIVATVRSAFDERLCITARTAWNGMSPELENKLRHVLSQGQASA